MGILVSEATSVVVVGIDDPEVQAITGRMIAYGTKVVAGVSEARAGSGEAEVPVYRTIAEAVSVKRPNAALIAVPLAAVLDACLEALNHSIRLLVVATPGVPERATSLIADRARDAMARVIGPGSDGLISPADRVMIGTIGGDDATHVLSPGGVGILTGSGEAAARIGKAAAKLRLGASIAISAGSGGPRATTPAQLLPLFESDRETKGVVFDASVIAGDARATAGAIRSRRYTKPLLVATSRQASTGTRMNSHHPMPSIGGPGPADIEPLRELGVLIAERPGDLEQFLSLTFLSRPYLGNPFGDVDDA